MSNFNDSVYVSQKPRELPFNGPDGNPVVAVSVGIPWRMTAKKRQEYKERTKKNAADYIELRFTGWQATEAMKLNVGQELAVWGDLNVKPYGENQKAVYVQVDVFKKVEKFTRTTPAENTEAADTAPAPAVTEAETPVAAYEAGGQDDFADIDDDGDLPF